MGKQYQRKNLLRKVFFVLLLVIFSGACSSSKQNIRPDWIANIPVGQVTAVGSASYAIFGEAKARENAIMKALAELALQKGGVVDLESSINTVQVVDSSEHYESYREHSSVKINAVIRGQNIPVKANVNAYWKDAVARRIWVLLVEE